MTFAYLTAKARKDPLGPQYLNALRENVRWVRELARVEHMMTGEHNAWEVPRVCARVDSAGTTITGDARSYISSGARPGTGQYTLTLASNIFTTDMRVQLNAPADDVINKPHLFGYEIASATSLKVYINKLSSALGAGNAWTTVNAAFDIAIHSEPLAPGTQSTLPQTVMRGMTLDTTTAYSSATGQAEWNKLVRCLAELYTTASTGHSSAGVHSAREVAKYYGRFAWQSSSSKYLAVEASTGMSANYVSTGICEVTYTALTAPVSAFPVPDYARYYATGTVGDRFVMHAYETSTTKTTVYMYQYDPSAKTWARANGDFFLAVHGV